MAHTVEEIGGNQPEEETEAAPEAPEAETKPAEESQEEAAKEETDEEVTVSIGDTPAPQEQNAAPEWVRELRKQNRELARRAKELEAKLAGTAETKPAVTLGKKPTLAEHDYDEEKFDTALSSWYDRKRAVEAEQAKARSAEEAQKAAWQATLDAYGKEKASIKVPDFEDAESTILETFNVTQQGVILQGADKPALLVYALGKNPAKAKELAAISDPVKFSFAVAKLESQLRVSKREAPPPPERVVTSTARGGLADSTLERLRTEAEKTGDYSKVAAYKRQLKEKK